MVVLFLSSAYADTYCYTHSYTRANANARFNGNTQLPVLARSVRHLRVTGTMQCVLLDVSRPTS